MEVCMYVRALGGCGGGSSSSSSSSSSSGGGGSGGSSSSSSSVIIRTLGNLITGLHATSGVFKCVFQSKHADLVFAFVYLYKTS
jgi:hypothetical protein